MVLSAAAMFVTPLDIGQVAEGVPLVLGEIAQRHAETVVECAKSSLYEHEIRIGELPACYPGRYGG